MSLTVLLQFLYIFITFKLSLGIKLGRMIQNRKKRKKIFALAETQHRDLPAWYVEVTVKKYL